MPVRKCVRLTYPNLYVYVGGNPINLRDPSGHDGIAELMVAAGIVFTLEALFTPNVANAPTVGGTVYHDRSGDQVFDMLASLALAPPLKYLGEAVFDPALQWFKSFFPHPEAVPLGVLRLGSDEAIQKAAAWIKPIPGYQDVLIHGSEDAFWVNQGGNWVRLNQRSLATFIRGNGYRGGAIRLLSCETGALPNGIAQDLSNKLGAEVLAPTDTLWVFPGGSMTVGATPTANTGVFKTFKPGG